MRELWVLCGSTIVQNVGLDRIRVEDDEELLGNRTPRDMVR